MGRAFLTVLAAATLLVSGCTSEGSSPSENAASEAEQAPSSQPAGAVKGDLGGWPLDTVDCAEAFRVATYDGPVVEVDSGAVTSLMVCRSDDLLATQTLTPDNPAWSRVVDAFAAPTPTRVKRGRCPMILLRNTTSVAVTVVTGQGAYAVKVPEGPCGSVYPDIARALIRAGIRLPSPLVVP